MGYDERTIADMLGQKTIEMAPHYSRRADKSRKLTAVVANFDQECQTGLKKVSNLELAEIFRCKNSNKIST